MKTFKQFQEAAFAAPAIAGASKYVIPLLMTGIGAAGTIFQARKKNYGINLRVNRKAKKDEIACLDEGILEFTTVSFVESSLKTCTCQYSRNYGLPCRHQFAVAYFCGLKSFTIDFVDEFWWKVDDAENNFLANNNNLW